jgi:hypothetical protein
MRGKSSNALHNGRQSTHFLPHEQSEILAQTPNQPLHPDAFPVNQCDRRVVLPPHHRDSAKYSIRIGQRRDLVGTDAREMKLFASIGGGGGSRTNHYVAST